MPLLEVVLGPLWVWVFLSEKPNTATLVVASTWMSVPLAKLLTPNRCR